jgi:succinate dehydrogenase / fumarate reductase flavoprotein subunit
VADGIEVFMELKVLRLLHDADGTVSPGAGRLLAPSGEFVVFEAKAVVLATGGVGKSWMYTSNSWEYTGDGHAMALWAGADLIDMECVQFHPTGMVWPLSVRGILVTEGVRGDGGVLRNSEGKRFMFDYIPAMFAAETPTPRTRPTSGTTTTRRPTPPELLPRDEVARSINSEVKAGRGSPARRRVPRHRHPAQRRGHPPAPARRCTTSSRSWPASTSPPRPWRSGPPATTSWAASGRRRHRRRHRGRAVRRR